MDHFLRTVATAAGVFGGTDIDDLIVLTMLFLSARATGRPRQRQIWAGQYAGIAVLVAISLLAALGLQLVPDRWVGLLGLVPLALGAWGLIKVLRQADSTDAAPSVVAGWVSVAAVTIANGADNLSVYTPLFRTVGGGDSVIIVATFAVLVAVWCLAASCLGSHQKIVAVIERCGHILVPVVFMVIGAVILLESGAVA